VPHSVFTTAELCPPMMIPRLVCSRKRKAPCTLHSQRCIDSEHKLRGGVRRRSLPIQYSACSGKRSCVLQEGVSSNGSGQPVPKTNLRRQHGKFPIERCTVHVSTTEFSILTGIENSHVRPFSNRPITGRPPCRYPRGESEANIPQMLPDPGGICMGID